MKNYEIKKIPSGRFKGRYTVIVNGWQMYGSFKTEAEAIKHVEDRKAELAKPEWANPDGSDVSK